MTRLTSKEQKLQGLRVCCKCKELKQSTDFYLRSHKSKWLSSTCKLCTTKWTEYKKQRYINQKELVNRLKIKPCVDCGIQYNPWQMDFDHISPKNKTIGIAVASISKDMNTILKEIEKCELVCANCHRERTHQRSRVH